jgi:tetratricopeptide (TPR) repeat protein
MLAMPLVLFVGLVRTESWVQGVLVVMVPVSFLLLFALVVVELGVVPRVGLQSTTAVVVAQTEAKTKPSGPIEAELVQSVEAQGEQAHTFQLFSGRIDSEELGADLERQQRELLDIPEGESKVEETWLGKLFSEMFSKSMDLEKSQEAFDHVIEEEQDEERKFTLTLGYTFTRLQHNDLAALQRLEALVAESSDSPERLSLANYYLGLGHQFMTAHDKAEAAFRQSAELATDETHKARAIVALSVSMVRRGQVEAALTTLKEAVSATSSGEAKSLLYERIAKYYQETKQPFLEALALEKAVEYHPSNTHLRFSVAHAYGEANMNELSFWHYKVYNTHVRDDQGGLNNLGVQYKNLDLPTLAVDHYRRAKELGNTLSTANLAYLYLNAGFVADASRLVDEAKAQPDPHPNVASASARVAEIRADEEQKEQEILEKTRTERLFFSAYAAALFAPVTQQPVFVGTWQSREGRTVTITQEGKSITGKWVDGQYNVTLRAEANGWTFEVSSIRTQLITNEFITDYRAFGGYGYITENNGSISLMGTKAGDKFYIELTRAQTLEAGVAAA